MHVLIVDDVTANRRLPAVVLRRAGFEVSCAASGEAALGVLSHLRIDVVLLDLIMPGMGGIRLCRHLRASPEHRDVRIIAYTGPVDTAERDALLALGFDGLLIRPVAPAEVLRAVGHLADPPSTAGLAPARDPLPDQTAR
ncbi:response regulator [Nitrogeniibacter mangrovi]|uniref:Response regulator n=1 Tax=Nitrogeniibacter mangrovi TaxID=2016596 RepID=A0A6C1B3I0_9RHOO|nr:response regulator [Nitrogeniibacter mangrovi]QID18212.1 response regulator [Nitrogeniibacter mangrovi]